MSLRLGYMVPEFPGQTHIFFWREIEALRRFGVEVHLASTKRPSPVICQHDFTATALADTHYVYPPHFSSIPWLARGGAHLIRSLHYISKMREAHSLVHRCGLLVSAIDLLAWARRYNITHIHGHSCANSAHILALVNILGGPTYSLTLHGDLAIYGADHELKMEGAKFVCAVGEHLVRQVVEQVGVPADRVISTFMGVRTDNLKAIAENRVYDRPSLNLITVARLNQNKGHIYALEAVASAKAAGLTLRYTIVGEGPHRNEMIDQVRRLGLSEEVLLTGSLSEEEVFSLLSQSDVFILPSVGFGEAWPVAVMEAMSSGMPVIASRIGATTEMIRDGEDGYLVPQAESVSILMLLERLYRDCTLRRRIGREARKTAEQRFDVEKTSTTLVRAIEGSPLARPGCVRRTALEN